MQFSNPDFSAAVRKLTNIGAITSTPTAFASLAGATSVDLRTSAANLGDFSVTVLTGAGATAAIAIDMFDGTNTITIAATAAAATSAAYAKTISSSAVGPRVRNTDATHAGNYSVAGLTWSL